MRYISITLLFVSSLASASVSDEAWDKFCESPQLEAHIKKSCEAVDYVCEMHGFKTTRCDKARESIVNQKQLNLAFDKKK